MYVLSVQQPYVYAKIIRCHNDHSSVVPLVAFVNHVL